MDNFIVMAALYAVMLVAVGAYAYRKRAQLDEMHGMMLGMGLGMIAGLVAGTLTTIPQGNFLVGVITGSVVGLVFGVPFGWCGKHLGICEGIFAGPMGGMMGGMLGQMVRPFNLEVFIPFFTFIILISLASLSYAVHCGCSGCCGPERKRPAPVSNAFGASWMVGTFVLLVASVVLSFPLPGAEAAAAQSPTTLPGSSSLPLALQQFTQEIVADAVVKGGLQTADILISQSRYTPNVIHAKSGIPLRLNVRADETAGCARDIVFPDFSIRKIVPEGSTTTIELNFDRPGTYPFRCSMDMARGKIVVE